MEKDNNKWLLILIIAVGVLLLFGWSGMGSYGMMGFGFPFMFLFWAAVVWLTVTLINSGQTKDGNKEPLSMLKERYASGRITKKKYEEVKKEIEKE